MNLYFDTAQGPVFRPPSEANSFLLRVTVGCSHNRCTYCNMYRSVPFQVRPHIEVQRQIKMALPHRQDIRRIFLADGNALVLHTERLLPILQELRDAFPRLQRVSCYAGPRDILAKRPEELLALKEAGLRLIYYGMESGDSDVLQRVQKGVDGPQSIEAGQRIRAAGMKLSLMMILGLGGREASAAHAKNTAAAVSAICPDLLSALTLMLYRGSELKEEFEAGTFAILNPAELMEELGRIVEAIRFPEGHHCLFRSNHISNYVNLAATLPKERERLLADIALATKKLQQVKEWDPYNCVER